MMDLKIFTDNIDKKSLKQINTLLKQNVFKDCKVRIMPDVHAGVGCVIGFTGNMKDKIIPNLVGVDIGCGMLCAYLGKKDIDLKKIDNIIKDNIPSGFNVHEQNSCDYINPSILYDLKCFNELKNISRLSKSCGTLGGGNHFIEIDKDNENNKYLIIHTGSRNLGKQVADIYQKKAIKYCSYKDKMNKEIEDSIKFHKENNLNNKISNSINEIKSHYKIDAKLPESLCYLDGRLKYDYLHDMKICQSFAYKNRETILKLILTNYYEDKHIKTDSIEQFQTIHNYIDFNDNILRKGAISAHKDELLLIPMNMRDGCILGKGKGNKDWNYSAPHGAGRIMSRTEAKNTFKLDDFKKTMKDVYTTSICNETLDESPFAYKDSKEIIKNIDDTVDILKIIKPIYNFKATN